MRRSGYLRRFTPLRARSRKREREDRAYAELRAELLESRAGRKCEAQGFHRWHCSGYLTLHHLLRRSQGGSNAPENLIVVCTVHHRLIHSNPKEAMQEGFLLPGLGRRLR